MDDCEKLERQQAFEIEKETKSPRRLTTIFPK